ncbi:DUF1871 family protein [Ectobacillus ponti]|uniref:YugE family protein n=1 Tax=Ectobacillus ponti TaxID=2961894 RepID=A0AA41X9T8_9BACI|nr:DUF1871 family protein [Ectobacillus ponti]MCP8969813.1 YugE family protein [Ectobacillus ponti]
MNVYAKMVKAVKEWDPLRLGPDFYETEAVDVVQVAADFDDSSYIASKIQHIYFMSFEEVLPLEKCRELAKQLVEIKNADEGSCAM